MSYWSDHSMKCRYHVLPNGKACGKCCNRNALPGWTTCKKHRKNGVSRQPNLFPVEEYQK